MNNKMDIYIQLNPQMSSIIKVTWTNNPTRRWQHSPDENSVSGYSQFGGGQRPRHGGALLDDQVSICQVGAVRGGKRYQDLIEGAYKFGEQFGEPLSTSRRMLLALIFFLNKSQTLED